MTSPAQRAAQQAKRNTSKTITHQLCLRLPLSTQRLIKEMAELRGMKQNEYIVWLTEQDAKTDW